VIARTMACAAGVVTGLAVVYTVGLLLGMPDPEWAYLPRGVIHLGELATLLALGLSGAAGIGLLGRLGVGLGVLGALVLAVAEVLTLSAPATSETLFGVAPNLVGLGLILAGVAVVRTGRWTGWRRWVTLALGAYVFAVLTPLIIAAGGPPAYAAIAGLLGWQVLWVLIAVAVLVETERPALRPQPAR